MRIRVLNFLAAFHLTLTYMDVGAAEVKWVLVVRRLTPHRVTLRIRPATWCSGRECVRRAEGSGSLARCRVVVNNCPAECPWRPLSC